MKDDKGIVLYDFFRVLGGAETVASQLAEHYSADIAMGFNNLGENFPISASFPIEKIDFEASSSFLPLQLLRLLNSFYYKAKFLNKYDWAIYSGYYAPLAVRHQTRGKRIYYCHTPPRFMYDLKNYHEQKCNIPQLLALKAYSKLLKPLYERAFHSMDIVLANSENVSNRIKHYLGGDAKVVYPPCSLDNKHWNQPQGYYLSLARLEPYKRVDKLIKAFKEMPDKKLIIASGGSEYDNLKLLAADSDNITFTGWITQAKLNDLISNCIASLYIPINEDFGMSPVESMAAGKPVIGVAEGGLLETVIPNETGILINPSCSKTSIIDAVEKISSSRAIRMKASCEEQAEKFGRERFFQQIDAYLR